MRAISLVHKVEFELTGNVAKGAITLGDVDNDGHNELIIGNDKGEVAIFKGSERLQTLSDLSFVTCVAIGDIRNVGKNSLVIISADGWCSIYETLHDSLSGTFEDLTVCDADAKEVTVELDGQGASSNPVTTSETHSSGGEPSLGGKKSPVKNNLKNPLVCVHKQKIYENIKTMILDDVDSDGHIELVVGFDNLVRSYRFSSGKDTASLSELGPPLRNSRCDEEKDLQELRVSESTKQIGSITLHHAADGRPAIMVAQPGGTFMRIRCHSDGLPRIKDGIEYAVEVLPDPIDYQYLGISRMRNPNISTEILGDIKSPENRSPSSGESRPYAIATLDGTIMLVQDEVILWAIAVDHQVFALTKLDITGDGSDEIVACCWDGQTYILDQKKNSVRFHLEEPVKAFHSGLYTVDTAKGPVTALVYVTLKNTVVLYYDIPLTDLVCKKFEPDLRELSRLFISRTVSKNRAYGIVKSMDKKAIKDLVEYVLYHVDTK